MVKNPYVEYELLFPDMPEESTMYNYGLPQDEQVWRRVEIPKDYRHWPWQRKKQWADEMWHRRRNGEWWLINGKPVYLTGTAFLYFNFWHIGNKTLPDFKMQCVWWFQVMRDVEIDNNCFGEVEIKPRRAHSTEMSLCWGWDMITKYRDSKMGIMSKTDNEAEMAFDRLVFSAMKMHHIFKPKNTGSDRPQATLEYQYPAKRIGTSNVASHQEEDMTPELHSKVWFEPTVEGKFDGEKLRAALFDEIGKIPVSKMDVTYQWDVMRECMSLNMRQDIIGKAIIPSTIEDMDDGKSIAIVQKFWDTSDPSLMLTDDAGRTISGCKRMFRPYWITANVDKFGYPLVEDARKYRNAQLESYLRKGLLIEAADWRRRYPETVQEALAPPSGEASLPTELIDLAISNIAAMPELKAVRGTFSWKNGVFGGDVVWMPDPNGRWEVSRHPDKPNNYITLQNGRKAPGNTDHSAMGVDPFDAMMPKTGGSDGAFCVGMMHEPIRDMDMSFDEHDILLTNGMWSDSCACDYASRPFRPEEFYEDALMTAIYFGCQMLVEYNKPGLVNWGFEKGFGAYFAQKPVNADANWMRRGKNTTPEAGTSATPATIDNYYRHLRSHIIRRWRNYTHPRLLADLKMLTATNRTERDLSVAWGWTLTNMNGLALKKNRRNKARPEDAAKRQLPIRVHRT